MKTPSITLMFALALAGATPVRAQDFYAGLAVGISNASVRIEDEVSTDIHDQRLSHSYESISISPN